MAATEVPYDQLTGEQVERVIEVLTPLATPDRLARFESVLTTRTRDVALVLEDIANAHNAAAIFRTAEAFGFFEVHVVEPTTGSFKVSRNIAKGAQQWLDLRWYSETRTAVAGLKARGFSVWVADVQPGAVPIHDVDVSGRVALMFGNERTGPTDGARDLADGRFMVPMHGFVESFNVSVATAISCYDVLMRRRGADLHVPLQPTDARAVLAAWLARSVRSSPDVLARAGIDRPIIGRPGLPLIDTAR